MGMCIGGRRISRSHLIHVAHLETVTTDIVTIRGQLLRIGKVYKRYATEQLTGKR